MAVNQISKIQVRRGLLENLPQLSSAEIGWAIDDQSMWIGNGSLEEGAPISGNTEIITRIKLDAAIGNISGNINNVGLTLVSSSVSPTFDFTVGVFFSTQKLVLTSNVTPVFKNATPGQLTTVIFQQNNVGNFIVNWPANVVAYVEVGPDAESYTVFQFVYDGSNYVQVGVPIQG
jgi:hypothetical protein